jgi:hypothetical protein
LEGLCVWGASEGAAGLLKVIVLWDLLSGSIGGRL